MQTGQRRGLADLRRRAKRWSARSGWVVVVVGGLTAVLAATLSLLRPPLPRVHDEFCYLLAADTFAHGRLTNPAHPLWPHFETFHVLQQPTYAAKYPPAQGLILAIGKVLAGNPDWGLWISVGLAAGGVCWMLLGWMPRRWALLGGILIAFHARIQLDWSQTYWGGDLALFGGALVLGAYPRLRRRCRAGDALAMAAGLAILANTRPYEGFVTSLPVAAAMVVWLLGQRRPPWRVAALRIVLPLVLTLTVVAAWMGYYNLRVTGRVSRMPYQAYEAAYGYTPLFLWQSPRTAPEYRHEVMRDFYLRGIRGTFDMQQTVSGFLHTKGRQLTFALLFFLPPPLVVALLGVPAVVRRRAYWLPLAMLAACLLALLGASWIYPHYAAPALPALFLVIVQALRYLRLLRCRGKRLGRLLVSALIVSHLLLFLILGVRHLVREPAPFPRQRAQLLEELQATPGRHLVIVTYGRNHNYHDEWVYNEADIDEARVVWARSMNAEADRRLLQYFASRQIWLLRRDEQPARLVPYGGLSPR